MPRVVFVTVAEWLGDPAGICDPVSLLLGDDRAFDPEIVTLEAARAAELLSHAEDGALDLAVILPRSCLRLSPRGFALGTVRIRHQVSAVSGPPGARVVAIRATATWHPGGTAVPRTIAEGSAPTYVRDTRRDLRARERELSWRVAGLAVRRILADPATPCVVPPSTTGEGYLDRRSRARWHLRRALARLRRRVASARYVAKVIGAAIALWAVRPVRDAYRTLTRTHPVRVFTFHRVTDLCRDGMTVAPRVFRQQVAYIRSTHRVVNVEEALQLLQRGERLPRPVATITFDDAYRSVLELAAPIMEDAGVVGCCFVCTDVMGDGHRFPWDRGSPVVDFLSLMTWEDLQALASRGWTIGSHTATHPRLSECDRSRSQRELKSSLLELRARLGTRPLPIAYPFGGPSDVPAAIARLAIDVGYAAGFTNHGGDNTRGIPHGELRRIDTGGDHDGLDWRVRVHGFDLSRWLARGGRDSADRR